MHHQEALSVYEDAYQVRSSDKLASKISKIKRYIEEQRCDADAEQGVKVEGGSLVDGREAEEYNRLVIEGKQLIRDQKVKEALQKFSEAYKISPSEKLRNKMKKCQVSW